MVLKFEELISNGFGRVEEFVTSADDVGMKVPKSTLSWSDLKPSKLSEDGISRWKVLFTWELT